MTQVPSSFLDLDRLKKKSDTDWKSASKRAAGSSGVKKKFEPPKIYNSAQGAWSVYDLYGTGMNVIRLRDGNFERDFTAAQLVDGTYDKWAVGSDIRVVKMYDQAYLLPDAQGSLYSANAGEPLPLDLENRFQDSQPLYNARDRSVNFHLYTNYYSYAYYSYMYVSSRDGAQFKIMELWQANGAFGDYRLGQAKPVTLVMSMKNGDPNPLDGMYGPADGGETNVHDGTSLRDDTVHGYIGPFPWDYEGHHIMSINFGISPVYIMKEEGIMFINGMGPNTGSVSEAKNLGVYICNNYLERYHDYSNRSITDEFRTYIFSSYQEYTGYVSRKRTKIHDETTEIMSVYNDSIDSSTLEGTRHRTIEVGHNSFKTSTMLAYNTRLTDDDRERLSSSIKGHNDS